MKKLPVFQLFTWAQCMPVFVIDGQVMIPSRQSKDNSALLEWEGQTYGLARVQTLEEMASDYFKQNVHNLEHWQAEALLEKEPKTALLSVSKDVIQNLETVVFLGHRLIPGIKKMRGETVAPFPIPTSAAARIKRRLNHYSRSFDQSLLDLAPLWSGLPAVKGWGIIEGQLYHLVLKIEEEMEDNRNRIALADNFYALEAQKRPIQVIKENFYERLAELLLDQARRNLTELKALSDEVRLAIEPYEKLFSGLKRDSDGRVYLYDSATWCVFYWQSEWFIGFRVGPYALQDSDGSIYSFDPTTVVVRVGPGGNPRPAEVLSTYYEHPFLSSSERIICMGDYAQTRSHSVGSLSPEKLLLQYLMDARQTLVGGYHQDNTRRPYHFLCEFPHRRITQEQAATKKVPVYPYYRR